MLKTIADRIVACETDVKDASEFFTALENKTKVKLYFITEEAIEKIRNIIPDNVPILKGTLLVHQMATAGNGLFQYRDVSCLCDRNNKQLCLCFRTKEYRCKCDTQSAHNPQKLKVSEIYSSASENELLSTDEDSEKHEQKILKKLLPKNIKAGVHMLVKFESESNRKLTFKYAVIAQEDINEGEVKVMSLKIVNNNPKLFRADEKDISYVDFAQIIEILPEPKFKLQGGRLYYEFPFNVNVYEKA